MRRFCDIGVIGLGVMGGSIARNFGNHGFKVGVYNHNADKVEAFRKETFLSTNFEYCIELETLVNKLVTPRKILLMVPAGAAVDQCIKELLPLLDKNDLIIDGGNSYFMDTMRRFNALAEEAIRFAGCGISGGEYGALHGPSMMFGGSGVAWELVRDIFQRIGAMAEGKSCCNYIGTDGSGHYVKMVHNGIEYGDMQLICEIYWLLKNILHCDNKELHQIFSEWNGGVLSSYLIEITAKIFITPDDAHSAQGEVLDKILDVANQKGTGRWSSINALELNAVAPTVCEAVFARNLSDQKSLRQKLNKIYPSSSYEFTGDRQNFIEAAMQALYCAKICSYAQGFELMFLASEKYEWELDFCEIAEIWRGGCIIRADFLNDIANAYRNRPNLRNMLLDEFFVTVLNNGVAAWRSVVAESVKAGLPTPGLSSALAYFDGMRSAELPVNLLQAQRDFFGAHTFERVDAERGKFFHVNWEE